MNCFQLGRNNTIYLVSSFSINDCYDIIQLGVWHVQKWRHGGEDKSGDDRTRGQTETNNWILITSFSRYMRTRASEVKIMGVIFGLGLFMDCCHCSTNAEGHVILFSWSFQVILKNYDYYSLEKGQQGGVGDN